MELRQLQILLPARRRDTVHEILDRHQTIDRWEDALSEEKWVVTVLLPSEGTEPLLDELEQAFEEKEPFRLMLMPVQATIPRVRRKRARRSAVSIRQTATEDEDHHTGLLGRINREELYTTMSNQASISGLYIVMAGLSAVVASLGLTQDQTAVVIGAMVIAPLLGPNIALGLATALADGGLARQSFQTNGIGLALAVAISALLGWAIGADPGTPAIADRTAVSVADLALALASGVAGCLAFTAGMGTAVVGVMVAVALLPPAATCGLMIGAQHWQAALGAAELLLINVICLNLASVLTFVLQGVRPRTWWEASRARRATRVAIAVWLVLLVILGVLILLTAGPVV